ncbi:P-loop containing nucleoside triphosphate hydrolase protein [Elaphomyces granulatus]
MPSAASARSGHHGSHRAPFAASHRNRLRAPFAGPLNGAESAAPGPPARHTPVGDDVSEIEQFVAREEELAEIDRTLRGDGSRRIVVLHGLGGIGKTQLTVAYTKRHKDNYSAVFWLNIKDEDSLKQSFVKVAKQILREHSSASSVDINENIDEVIDVVKVWLSLPNNTRWLMIYDNYDNPKLAGNTDLAAVYICKYLPESYQGSILITTRSSEVKIRHRIRIKKLEAVRDSVKILSNASRREGLEDGILNEILDPDAVKFAKELDGLPLALATAGAYLDQTAISFSDYLRLYKASWAKLLTTSPELRSYEDRMLYSTWQLSFYQDSIHGCVHSWTAYVLNQEWDYDLAKLALKFVGSHVPRDESANKWWLTQRRLLPHAARCSHAVLNGMVIEWELDRLGLLYANQGKLDEAEKMHQRALQGKEKAWGLDHTTTLNTVDNLGNLYAVQGKLDEAGKMYQRALQGYEKLGLENIARYRPALKTILNQGNLFAAQGHLDEAKEMYSRAYTGFHTVLGPSSIECQYLEHRMASLDPTQAGTRDIGGTREEVEVAANIASDRNEKKKSRSVVGKLMLRLKTAAY